MIPHVSLEDAQRWAPDLKSDAEFLESSLASGKTQRGRLLLSAFRLCLHEAAYHRVMGDTAAVRRSFGHALDRFSVLASAADVDPEWLRIALEQALPVALVLKDEASILQALVCAERLMAVDKDARDYFCAACVHLYKGDRAAAVEYVDLIRQEKDDGRYSCGLLEALSSAITGNSVEFSQGLAKAIKAYDCDIASGGQGSPAAVFFFPPAGLLALNRYANPNQAHEMPRDERLLPDFA